jgi:TPR repeat protein
MDWTMKATSTGNVEAQYDIGGLYHSGDGVPRIRQQAIK